MAMEVTDPPQISSPAPRYIETEDMAGKILSAIAAIMTFAWGWNFLFKPLGMIVRAGPCLVIAFIAIIVMAGAWNFITDHS